MICLNGRGRGEKKRKGWRGREGGGEKERDSCCIFTQTWSVLPLCHSTTWTELCGRLRHAVMNDTKQDNFCSHCRSCGARWLDTASVSYHRFLFLDTCILSMSPTQPVRLSTATGKKLAFGGQARGKTSDS